MGNMYMAQGQVRKALKLLRMALDQAPASHARLRTRIMHNIGLAHVRMGRYVFNRIVIKCVSTSSLLSSFLVRQPRMVLASSRVFQFLILNTFRSFTIQSKKRTFGAILPLNKLKQSLLYLLKKKLGPNITGRTQNSPQTKAIVCLI